MNDTFRKSFLKFIVTQDTYYTKIPTNCVGIWTEASLKYRILNIVVYSRKPALEIRYESLTNDSRVMYVILTPHNFVASILK